MALRLLPKVRLVLRWRFPGRGYAGLRAAVLRTAERAAGDDQSPAEVWDAVVVAHGHELIFSVLAEIGQALRDDIPIDDLGAAVLRTFSVGVAHGV